MQEDLGEQGGTFVQMSSLTQIYSVETFSLVYIMKSIAETIKICLFVSVHGTSPNQLRPVELDAVGVLCAASFFLLK